MTDMRRTILWVVFTMSLVLLWDAWNKHQGHPSMFGMPTPTATAPATPANGSSAPGVPAPAGGTVTAQPAGAVPGTAPAVPAATPTVTVTTDVLKATLDARGGDVVRLELLKHVDQNDRSKNVVLFDRTRERVYLAQSGLIGAPDLPNHLTVLQAQPGETALKDGVDELSVVFESPVQGGAKLTKTLTFSRDSYAVKVKHDVANVGSAALAPQLYQQLVRDGTPPPGESSFYSTFTGPAMYTEASKFVKLDFKDIAKGKHDHDQKADNGWVAMVQHYFFSAWLHNEQAPREFRTQAIDAAAHGVPTYSIAAVLPLGSIEPGASKSIMSTLYAGPQEEKRLEALAPGLELVKDYGWFTILAKPLFWLLDQLHKLIGNWGWAIVALVVLIKAAFYWLNAKAYASMAKMKAINPKITEMRERLKDKPQQMQQEMMRIYREEKVNPMGGCLPIMIQIPVFIALYWVLLSSVEMRNAPWLGWITDLSAKDPFYILPLVMTGTTLLQTWLNPTPPDPVQAKMMWIMPLAFSVMFFVFPAGLVLYWITNNLLSIAQQWVINRRLGVN